MNKRYKILHLLTSLNPGGAEANLVSLLKKFDHKKYHHVVAYGGSDGALKAELIEQGIDLIELSPTPLGVKSLLLNRKIISRIVEFSPDVIHSHLDLVNVIGLLAKQKSGCKLILHFHGLGMVPHNMLPDMPFKHRLWNLISKAYRYSDKAIAICEFQKPLLKDIGFIEDKIVIIPNGVNLYAKPPKFRCSSDGYKFINIGRLHRIKDQELLVRAFSNVLHHFPDSHLSLVGDGPLRTSLEELVINLGLVGHVEFYGLRRDIDDILAVHDCFVLSSRWELHPVTILEAMRAGLPVISSDVGGVKDTLDNGVTGLLTQPENINSISQAMLKLAANPELGRKMGERGRRKVESLYNNNYVAKKIESVYHDVMELD